MAPVTPALCAGAPGIWSAADAAVGAGEMPWCCPRGGANDGGYRKLHLGNGYPERAVYASSADYRPVCAWVDSPELL